MQLEYSGKGWRGPAQRVARREAELGAGICE